MNVQSVHFPLVSDYSDGDGRFETEYVHIDDIEGIKLSKDIPPSPDDKCA